MTSQPTKGTVMKALRQYSALLLLTLAAGCANFGVPTPDTFNQKLAVAIASVTAVRSTATTLLQAKKIDAADAVNVQASADTARTGIEVARTLAKADITAADNKLTAVTTALQAIQVYLSTKGK